MKIPETILQCDLAILSYHLYHQSVVWPLDPWYDSLSMKSGKQRPLFMTKVHEWCDALDPTEGFRGPAGSTFGDASNTKLDPVLTRYDQINPRLPAFTRSGSSYLSIQTPAYIVDRIGTVEVSQYKSRPNLQSAPAAASTEIKPICSYPNGSDHLIGFEGGHGLVSPTTMPVWSLMGYVLARQDPNDDSMYDIHIAFRGSRSGDDIGTTVKQALKEYGNADWVTDLSDSKSDNPWVSHVGTVGKGFGLALQTCFGTVLKALKRLNGIYGTPRRITVTGHSLGAALSCHMALAMAHGKFRGYLEADLPKWPWNSIEYVGWAQPPCGNTAFSANYAMWVKGRFFWLEGDLVVTLAEGKKTGKLLGMTRQHGGQSVMYARPKGSKTSGFSVDRGYQLWLPGASTVASIGHVLQFATGESSHELYLARAAILIEMAKAGTFPDAKLSAVTPWATYENFVDVVESNPTSYIYPGAAKPAHITLKNIRSVLLNYRVGQRTTDFLSILKQVVLDPNAYSKKQRKKSGHEAVRTQKGYFVSSAETRMKTTAKWEGKTRGALATQAIENLVSDIESVANIDENMATYLGLGAALDAFLKSGVTWQELKMHPRILECLKA